jgi:hypothetical protein
MKQSMTMKRLTVAALLSTAWLVTAPLSADVRQGLVSYWPFDAVESSGTDLISRDLVSGNHMVGSQGLLMDDLVDDPVRGKVLSVGVFEANAALNPYMYFHSPAGVDTGLPITLNPAWTVMFWVNATYPIEGQNDRRVFSESSSTNNDPLANIGTHNTGANGAVNLFFRNSGARVPHTQTPNEAYDGTWRHVAVTVVPGSPGSMTVYLDGEPDLTLDYTPGPVPLDITSVGAIVRGAEFTNIAAQFTGLIDDLAVWERALSQAEIQQVIQTGIQTPVPPTAPAITGPPAGGEFLVGDSVTLTVSVTGTRPLNFQWQKDGVNVAGATGSTLTLENLQEADSGSYTVTVSNSAGSVTSEAALVTVGDWAAPDLNRSIISFWPLDTVVGDKTPDLVSGYDLSLNNMTAANLVPGRFGNAFQFSAETSTALYRINNPGEDLPIYQKPEFSVSMWVRGPVQTDRRVFSEGATANNQPLFNIGTHNTGANAFLDSYIRTDTGATANHQYGTLPAFDDQWRHITYVQREVGGVRTAMMYVDGVEDTIVPQPVTPLTLNTTSLGAILRSGFSAHYTGLIDEVAIWERALSPAEVALLQTTTIVDPPTREQPLAINVFRADFPAVVKGQQIVLRWDVSKDASQVSISPGVGDVTANTLAGAGNVAVTLDETTTFTLAVTRGGDSITKTARVAVVDEVGSGWVLLDNYDTYAVGVLSDSGDWLLDTRGREILVESPDGNHMVRPAGPDSAGWMNLYSHRVLEEQTCTLFFRMIPRGTPAAGLRQIVGLTDKPLRWYGDSTDNVGPAISLSRVEVVAGGGDWQWVIGARNDVGGVLEYHATPLTPDTLYSVWIDITNVPMEGFPYADIYTVYLQKEGDPGRTLLFNQFASDRDRDFVDAVLPLMSPVLDKMFISSSSPTESSWFDDFYLYPGGFSSAIPRAPGFTGVPTDIAVGIGLADGQVTVSFESGVLESAPTANGPWDPVEGAAAPSHTVTPSDAQEYFRVRN